LSDLVIPRLGDPRADWEAEIKRRARPRRRERGEHGQVAVLGGHGALGEITEDDLEVVSVEAVGMGDEGVDLGLGIEALAGVAEGAGFDAGRSGEVRVAVVDAGEAGGELDDALAQGWL